MNNFSLVFQAINRFLYVATPFPEPIFFVSGVKVRLAVFKTEVQYGAGKQGGD